MNKIRHGLAVMFLLVCSGFTDAAEPPPALPADSVYQLSLPLTDSNGQTRDWRELRGKPRLLSMFYTGCQYTCPLIVEAGKAIDRQLDASQQQRIGVVLISMDPARDTPATLRKVARQRRIDNNRWLLAAPPATAVRSVAAVLGVRYRQLADGGFNHSSEWILVDADGRILARTDNISGEADPAFLAEVRKAAGK